MEAPKYLIYVLRGRYALHITQLPRRYVRSLYEIRRHLRLSPVSACIGASTCSSLAVLDEPHAVSWEPVYHLSLSLLCWWLALADHFL
jgi:hypothetical protein